MLEWHCRPGAEGWTDMPVDHVSPHEWVERHALATGSLFPNEWSDMLSRPDRSSRMRGATRSREPIALPEREERHALATMSPDANERGDMLRRQCRFPQACQAEWIAEKVAGRG
jgi:hypothetical protein